MKLPIITIAPEQDDEGRTVYSWSVDWDDEHFAGGYCATVDEAKGDAVSWLKENS